MPELPEVEASRALIDKHCTGRTIVEVTAADDTSEYRCCTELQLVLQSTSLKLNVWLEGSYAVCPTPYRASVPDLYNHYL
jgi:formamidopyrimidine-DNA glycosylase